MAERPKTSYEIVVLTRSPYMAFSLLFNANVMRLTEPHGTRISQGFRTNDPLKEKAI